MIRVAVRYVAQLRQAAGAAEEAVELEGPCPLPQLVRRLAERHGEAFRRIVLGPGDALQPSVLLFVGDAQVRGDAAVELKDGDVVTVLAPMAGG